MEIEFKKLAEMLVNHSTNIQPNERVLITVPVNAIELGRYLVKAVYKKDGYPVIEYVDEQVTREKLDNYSSEKTKIEIENRLKYYESFQAIISFRSKTNDYEIAHIDPETMKDNIIQNSVISEYVVNKTKWVVLDYPSDLMASKSKMSKEKYIDFYNKVCLIDYTKLEKALQPLKELMDKTNNVRITGPGTDISFSIKNIKSIICSGKRNVPDGEVYTSPVKNSVNGTITYNTVATYGGDIYENIKLEFKDGKIIGSTCQNGDNEKLSKIFDTDEGARYIGEFALGVNPIISDPIGNILFDEKIHGSLHFTPGNAYANEADNGNRSAIHWDIILIQRPEHGGGKIYFDDVLVREDGKFKPKELQKIDEL
jgi:aminopeptidase